MLCWSTSSRSTFPPLVTASTASLWLGQEDSPAAGPGAVHPVSLALSPCHPPHWGPAADPCRVPPGLTAAGGGQECPLPPAGRGPGSPPSRCQCPSHSASGRVTSVENSPAPSLAHSRTWGCERSRGPCLPRSHPEAAAHTCLTCFPSTCSSRYGGVCPRPKWKTRPVAVWGRTSSSRATSGSVAPRVSARRGGERGRASTPGPALSGCHSCPSATPRDLGGHGSGTDLE